MFSGYVSLFYSFTSSFVLSGYQSRFYYLFLFFLFLSFSLLRFPFSYGLLGFSETIFLLVFPLFFSLFLCRVVNFLSFSASFVPEGSPQSMAFFVRFAELISYFIRPFVLMLRPYLNLSLGSLVCHFVWSYLYSGLGVLYLFLGLLLFFYEVFVTIVHWYIVNQILFVSEDH